MSSRVFAGKSLSKWGSNIHHLFKAPNPALHTTVDIIDA